MATLLNDRNEFLYTADSRVTGATVLLTAGAVGSLVVPKNSLVPVPGAVTLTASATGYVTPVYVWSYRFGDTGTYTTIAQTTSTITVTLDEAWLTQASSNSAVEYKVEVSETTSNIGVNTATGLLSLSIIREGLDALNSAVIELYKRTTTDTAPTVDYVVDSNSTYTFALSQVIGQPTGWSQSVPSATQGAYLWQIRVPAASREPQYQFSNTLWSAPVLYTQDGTSGTSGLNGAVVYAYKRSVSAVIDNPGTVDYDFSTRTISTATLANNWQKTIPSGTAPLYVTTAVASSTSLTDQILSSEWAAPVVLAQNGVTGNSVFVATIYQQSATLPATPVATASTYNFSTNTLTPPSGWSATQPATTTTPTYACNFTFSGAPGTTVTGTGSWSAPYIEAVNGSNGNNGEFRDVIQLYLTSATAPTAPTSLQYTFTGNVYGTVTGGTAGWTSVQPAASITPTYITRALASTTTPGTALAVTGWSTPVIASQTGANGANGTNGADGANAPNIIQLYARNNSITSYPSLLTQNQTFNLSSLAQTARAWSGFAVRGTNVYASVLGGGIYKQTSGAGNFVALSGTARNWRNMTTRVTDLYACVSNGDIYRAASGSETFTALSQTTRNWYDVEAYGSDVYACVYGGDIYKQYGGTGNFLPLNQATRNWSAMVVLGSDIYACVFGGDIYVQYNGTGDFISTGQVSRNWSGLAIVGGEVYATVQNGDIYRRRLNTEQFISLGLGNALRSGMATLNTTIYVAVDNASVFTLTSTLAPYSATYTFSTDTLTGTLPQGWTRNLPSITSGAVLWVTQAAAISATDTDTIAGTEWSIPVILDQSGLRGSRQLYVSDTAYTSTYTSGNTAAGPASYAVEAASLVQEATLGTFPRTPIAGDIVTFSNNVTRTYTGSISGFVLTVTSATTGHVAIGQTLSGTGILTGTTIVSQTSGTTGGTGVYNLSRSQTVASTTITATTGDYVYTVTYDAALPGWKTPGTVIDGSLLVTGSVTANKINTNGLEVRDGVGNVILSAGVPLSRNYIDQTVNQNLVRGLGSWPRTASWSITTLQLAVDNAALLIPAANNNVAAVSPVLNLPNGQYTLSFTAYVDSGTRQLNADLFPDTLPETIFTVTSTSTVYKTTWNLTGQAGQSACNLRFFAPSGSSALVICNVKLERGTQATGWTPNSQDSISANSDSILSSTVSVNAVSGAGFRAGDLQWDASGVRIGGRGVAMTPGGLLGHNGTKTTFAINSSTGDATFGGTLQAASGSFTGDISGSNGTFTGTVAAGNVTGALMKATTIPPSYAGWQLTISSAVITYITPGVTYWTINGNGGRRWAHVGGIPIDGPEGTAPHRIAVVFTANASSAGGSQSMDLEVIALSRWDMNFNNGLWQYSGEQISNTGTSGSFNNSATISGATQTSFSTSKIVDFFVSANNCNFILGNYSGLLWGVR